MCKTRGARGLLLPLLAVLLLVPPRLTVGQQVGPADACRKLLANPSGIAGADIVVSTTPVTILARDVSRCGALVSNAGTQALRCTTLNQSAPTATAGTKLAPGAVRNVGVEAQTGLRCVRDTSATGSGAVSTWELYP